MSEFDAVMQKYLAWVESSGSYMANTRAHGRTLSYTKGKRFARVIGWTGVSRHAIAFVELSTGDIYAPDGWKGPRLNFSRGNISVLP